VSVPALGAVIFVRIDLICFSYRWALFYLTFYSFVYIMLCMVQNIQS